MEIKKKQLARTKVVFYTLIALFILLLCYMFFAPFFLGRVFNLVAILALIFFALGITLIFMARKLKVEKKQKRLRLFLIMTGAAAAGILVFAILHNLVYGLFIYLFGENFWVNIGIEDEPVFFILATIICPIIFLIGVIGSLIQFRKKRN